MWKRVIGGGEEERGGGREVLSSLSAPASAVSSRVISFTFPREDDIPSWRSRGKAQSAPQSDSDEDDDDDDEEEEDGGGEDGEEEDGGDGEEDGEDGQGEHDEDDEGRNTGGARYERVRISAFGKTTSIPIPSWLATKMG